MKKVILITLFIIFLFYVFFGLSTPIFAAEFSISYDVTYKVNQLGITTVTNKISLTNLKSDLYAKEYTILIGSEKIENIQGFDSLGKLEIEVSKKETNTEMKATFNERVVGKGKILAFTLSYDTPEIATKQGRIWEINIPKPLKDETISSYKITLSVPPSFGKPAYLKPKPAFGLTWTLNELSLSSINVAFGRFQSFNFNLLYHLKNNSLTTRLYQIALPPDTLYQKVLIKTLSPVPKNVILDEDANWLAQYQLFPQQSLEVLATGSAYIFLEKRQDFPLFDLTYGGKHLEQQKFWEKSEEEITRLAKELKTPKKIYQYVVKTLSYDIKRVGQESERLGAKQILENPKKATCMEFTDLFIALCRAAGIPAREINGFSFSSNPALKPLSLVEDVLHAWPEYFDSAKQTWIPVDPTWEKTTGGIDYFDTFDFNHFAFVIHGISSETPIPPGAYKLSESKEKNVNISFSEGTLVDFPPEPELLIDFPKKAVAGAQIRGQVTVRNPGFEALSNLSLEVLSSDLSPQKEEFKIRMVPPFGAETFNLSFSCQNFLFWGENKFVFRLGKLEKKIAVLIRPWIISFSPYLLSISVILATLSLSFILFKKIWRSK